MKEYVTHIELDGEVLVDVDPLTNDFYIGITNFGTVIFPFQRLKIIQPFKFPIVRQFSKNSFLIADARTTKETDNGFIYDLKGNLLRQFYAGDGIQDVEIVNGKIIITYFDEGVFGTDGPNNEGLVIFNDTGKPLFNFNSNYPEQQIVDCYCICKHETDRVLFLPYTEFPLVDLNVNTGKQRQFEIPEELQGSNAMTSISDSMIFHSPYEDKRGLYKWKVGNKKAEKIGEYYEGLRGLGGGEFLTKGDKGFTILDLN